MIHTLTILPAFTAFTCKWCPPYIARLISPAIQPKFLSQGIDGSRKESNEINSDWSITHHETRCRHWLRSTRIGRVNLRVSLLFDRRLLRWITGSFQTVDGIRASLQRRCVITFYRRRWEERGASGRIGARIVILPPAIYLTGDAQAVWACVVRRYLEQKETIHTFSFGVQGVSCFPFRTGVSLCSPRKAEKKLLC